MDYFGGLSCDVSSRWVVGEVGSPAPLTAKRGGPSSWMSGMVAGAGEEDGEAAAGEARTYTTQGSCGEARVVSGAVKGRGQVPR
jgi:hypothetical protein